MSLHSEMNVLSFISEDVFVGCGCASGGGVAVAVRIGIVGCSDGDGVAEML